ncbi:hypothetical protein QP157_02205 [Sphingomonas sp. LR61]|uniref:hypothetical protein n=1 Tax=Sphingomonas sp. LR61 TaxID=3050234 RepID=UPI002FDF8393
MITIERVSWGDPRSVALRARMDDEMHERYGSSNGDEDPAITAEPEPRAVRRPVDRRRLGPGARRVR